MIKQIVIHKINPLGRGIGYFIYDIIHVTEWKWLSTSITEPAPGAALQIATPFGPKPGLPKDDLFLTRFAGRYATSVWRYATPEAAVIDVIKRGMPGLLAGAGIQDVYVKQGHKEQVPEIVEPAIDHMLEKWNSFLAETVTEALEEVPKIQARIGELTTYTNGAHRTSLRSYYERSLERLQRRVAGVAASKKEFPTRAIRERIASRIAAPEQVCEY